nr:MAG TPA: hypothetical protein [Caudoviricetes sp.]
MIKKYFKKNLTKEISNDTIILYRFLNYSLISTKKPELEKS